MKKIDLGQAIAIFANVGVIVGIAFLAFELNQNNKLLRAQAEYNLMEGRLNGRRQIIFDPEYAEFVVRVSDGEPLSPADQLRVNTSFEAAFLGKQWEYGQFLDGNLAVTSAELVAQWRGDFHRKSEAEKNLELSIWADFRPSLRENFVRFVEDNVYSE